MASQDRDRRGEAEFDEPIPPAKIPLSSAGRQCCQELIVRMELPEARLHPYWERLFERAAARFQQTAEFCHGEARAAEPRALQDILLRRAALWAATDDFFLADVRLGLKRLGAERQAELVRVVKKQLLPDPTAPDPGAFFDPYFWNIAAVTVSRTEEVFGRLGLFRIVMARQEAALEHNDLSPLETARIIVRQREPGELSRATWFRAEQGFS